MMADETLFLYVDGLSGEFSKVLQYQLNMIARKENDKIKSVWTICTDQNQAHAYCLGEKHSLGELSNIDKPALLTYSADQTDLTFKVRFPITTAALIDALAWLEVKTNHFSASKDSLSDSTIDQTVGVVKELHVVDVQLCSEEHASKAMNFSAYLARFPEKEQSHLLTYAKEKVSIDAPNASIITTCATSSDLIALLLSDETAQCVSGNLKEGNRFSYDLIMWSVGLHGKISQAFLNQYTDNIAIRLKKWPLFGRWETAPKLLMLTTLFTQKFTSINEAVIRSGLEKEQVLHFLYAAKQARLPMECQEVVDNTTVTAKKKLGWVEELRNKLRVNETMVS